MARPTSYSLSLELNAQLFSHLAAMERAGVPVAQALVSLSLPARANGALAALRKQVAGGCDMASAGLRSGLFSPLDSSLIYAAQASGCLAQTYSRLAERYRHKGQQVALLKSRLLMPAAVLILALFIQPLPALVGGQLSLLAYLWLCLRPLLVLGVLYGLGRQLYQRQRQNPQGTAVCWLTCGGPCRCWARPICGATCAIFSRAWG